MPYHKPQSRFQYYRRDEFWRPTPNAMAMGETKNEIDPRWKEREIFFFSGGGGADNPVRDPMDDMENGNNKGEVKSLHNNSWLKINFGLAII